MTERPIKRARVARKPAGRFHHGDLREALIVAAERVVERDGHGAVSVTALSRAAGVTQPAAYRHFASKEMLLAEVGVRGYQRMVAALIAAASSEPEPRAAFGATMRAYVRFACAHPGWYRLWHSRLWQEQLARAQPQRAGVAARQQSMAPLIGLLRASLKPGAPVDDLFRTLWGTAHGLAGLVVERAFQLVETDAERIAAADVALELALDAVWARWQR